MGDAGNILAVRQDAAWAFEVLQGGGIAILPMDIGYSLIGGSANALARIFQTKQRAATKLNAMLGNGDIHREVHVVDQRGRDIVKAVTEDHDLPLGVVAPCRMDHPLMAALTPDARAGSTKAGTVAMLMNAGPFHGEICRLSLEHLHPLFGSSANRSLAGTKFRVEDIEADITAIADICIDYGLRKYHLYRASSTLLDVTTLEVVRHGACFELIADIMRRHFNAELTPPAPGYLADLIAP